MAFCIWSERSLDPVYWLGHGEAVEEASALTNTPDNDKRHNAFAMIRTPLRYLLATFYFFAGYRHIVAPEPFLLITPGFVPWPEAVVWWTGLAEIAGALALAQPFSLRLRQAGGIGLALYALCVWPANVNHMLMDLAREDGGWGMAYHIPRMIAQPLLIWLALWTGRVVRRPFNESR